MRKTTQRMVTVLGAALLLSVTAAGSSQAQVSQQYMAPFSCGTPLNPDPVLDGNYATTVDLHNPTGADAVIMSSVSLTFPPEIRGSGETSDMLNETLPPHSSIRIDCETIRTDYVFTPPGPALDPYAQGFVVIEASTDLGVSATQTASGIGGEVSVDVEQIEARRLDMRNGHKMDVCHRGRTINIALPAVPAHLAHGDTTGACVTP